MKKFLYLVTILCSLSLNAEEISNQYLAELISQKKYSEAIQIADALILNKTANAKTYFNLGIAKYQTNKFSEAEINFSKAISTDKDLKNTALYYRAIAQFDQEKSQAALESLQLVDSASELKPQADALAKIISEKIDASYLSAQNDYEDYEYENCLENIKKSYLFNSKKGQSLYNKCLAEIETEQNNNETEPVKNEENKLSYYIDFLIGRSDNVFLDNAAPTAKGSYSLSLGAEYIFKNHSDYGLGFNYQHNDYIDTTSARDSNLNLYLPARMYFENFELGFELYTNISQYLSKNVYNQVGFLSNIDYYWNDFDFVATLDVSRKNSTQVSYDYLNGNYTNLKLESIYFKSGFRANLFLDLISSQSKDLPVTGGTLPYAYKGNELGLFLGYWLTDNFRASVTSSSTKKKFDNRYSNVNREDTTNFTKIKFEKRTSENSRFYLELLNTVNVSSYNATQIVNKNYTEKQINIGFVYSKQ